MRDSLLGGNADDIVEVATTDESCTQYVVF